MTRGEGCGVGVSRVRCCVSIISRYGVMSVWKGQSGRTVLVELRIITIGALGKEHEFCDGRGRGFD